MPGSARRKTRRDDRERGEAGEQPREQRDDRQHERGRRECHDRQGGGRPRAEERGVSKRLRGHLMREHDARGAHRDGGECGPVQLRGCSTGSRRRNAVASAVTCRRTRAHSRTMASSLFALLDDIATGLDDVALLTKVAMRKTAGVLGDDLALNAQQVAGVSANRELPVVWAVAKGSLLNKAILVPCALAISSFAPWAVTPLLMVGGGFLCFEGCEKLAHRLLHSAEEQQAERAKHAGAVANPEIDLVAFEREKVKGAVRTDFVLSAEIVAIALGTVATATFMNRVWVLAALA